MNQHPNAASTIVDLIIIIVAVLVMAAFWNAFKDLLLNFGQSYPKFSTFFVAVLVSTLWWFFIVKGPKAGASTGGTQQTAGAGSAQQSGTSNVQQNANVSGGSTVNQASGNSTIINAPNATIINVNGNVTIVNPGVTPATVQKSLSDAAAAMRPDLLNKYPLGYILVGAASGKLVFEPEPVVLHFDNENKVSMTINEKTKTIRFGFDYFKIWTTEWPEGTTYRNVGLNLPLLDEPMEGHRAKLGIQLNIREDLHVTTWLEVLDLGKRIFVIGFTKE